MSYDSKNPANFDNTNSGVIFPNDKRQSDKSPTGKGSAEICCPHCGVLQKYWISSWIKVAKGSGNKFNSLAFTPDQPKINEPKPQSGIDFDEDIPFN